MPSLIRRIRATWNTTDTAVIGGNTLAFLLLIYNTQRESTMLCYVALVPPLLLQGYVQRRDATLRRALWFGMVVGMTWPLGEGIVVRVLGWWGRYLGYGVYLWDTALYCALIGWLACTYLAYLYERIQALGYRWQTAAFHTALSAIVLGAIGENLFVWSRMWEYESSDWDWFDVPAFVPIAYGLSYAFLPLVKRFPIMTAGLVFNAITAALACSLGLASGYFPR